MRIKSLLSLACISAAVLWSWPAVAQNADAANGNGKDKPEVNAAVHHDVSPALRDLTGVPRQVTVLREKQFKKLDRQLNVHNFDPVVQAAAPGPAVATTAGLNIPGVGNGDYGFVPNAAPPDTNGAVGATQYVQWVNESFAVFNKSSIAAQLEDYGTCAFATSSTRDRRTIRVLQRPDLNAVAFDGDDLPSVRRVDVDHWRYTEERTILRYFASVDCDSGVTDRVVCLKRELEVTGGILH